MDTENTPEITARYPKRLVVHITVSVVILIAGYIAYSLLSAKILARDAKRQADIMQIASALELYAKDHKSYPQNLEELLSKDKFGPYLSSVPAPPRPADGPCSNEQNQYAYKRTGQTGYELAYCLGRKGETRDFLSGKTKSTKAGVQKISGIYK